MGICVPKHVVCGWFDPTTDQTPPFISGATPCVLNSHTETRSRFGGSDFLFRSIDIGVISNNIVLDSKWLVLDGVNYRDYNQLTDTLSDVEFVRITISDGNIDEIYYATQVYVVTILPPVTSTWTNGLFEIQSQMNVGSPGPGTPAGQVSTTVGASQLVVMPSLDDGSPVNAPLPDVSFIPEFTTENMTGGGSGPSNPNGIRTGPGSSIIYMIGTEVPSGNIQTDKLNDGTLQPITGNAIRSWNGACFVGVNPLVPDCEDPNNPPADCTGPIC